MKNSYSDYRELCQQKNMAQIHQITKFQPLFNKKKKGPKPHLHTTVKMIARAIAGRLRARNLVQPQVQGLRLQSQARAPIVDPKTLVMHRKINPAN